MDRHLVSLQVPWIFVQVPGHQILWSSQWLERFLEGGRFISWNHQSVGPKHTQHCNFPVLLRPPQKITCCCIFFLFEASYNDLSEDIQCYCILKILTHHVDLGSYIKKNTHIHSDVFKTIFGALIPENSTGFLFRLSTFHPLELSGPFFGMASDCWLRRNCWAQRVFVGIDQWVTGWCSCGWLTLKTHWRLTIWSDLPEFAHQQYHHVSPIWRLICVATIQ